MSGPARSSVRLAVADMLHEWRMSLCLVLAVAAIAVPLLLFFGLKQGTVETLRQRLLDNPSTLELQPVTERLLDEKWFALWRQDPRVGFVVPHTRKLSAQADVAPVGGGTAKRLDLHPTLPGDMLLVRYGIKQVPDDGCVLSYTAAEQLGAEPGKKLTFTVTREQGRSKVTHDFEVVGVLPVEAGSLPSAYIPLAQLEAIEDYKDGKAVSAFGWPGQDPVAHAVARGVILALEEPPDAMLRAVLQTNTGFARLQEVTPSPDLPALPEGRAVYRMQSMGRGAGKDNILALQEKLRGLNAFYVPVFSDMEFHVSGIGVLKAQPAGGGESSALLEAMEKLAPLAEWIDMTLRLPPRVLLTPASLPEGEREIVCLLPGHEERSVSFHAILSPHPAVPEGMVLAPQALLGQLSLLEERSLNDGKADEGRPAFLLGRRGYSSFRMYASNMESVAPLAKSLEKEGMRISTKAERIEEIKRLDVGLSLLFWIIAATSSVGGASCLLSNIYANVERKRKDFAVLRLLGMHGPCLGLFPLVSSLALTLCGILVGLGVFHLMAAVIETVFREHLQSGEHFCALTLADQGVAFLIAAGLAAAAGCAAAVRLTSIDPAESLRDE